MRKSKKQLLRTLMACGLVVSVAAGGTVAYLTDAETATNTFTVGKVKIDLEEPGYPGNDSDDVKNIIPNQEVAKDPQIENTGNNDALVFLRVEVPQEEFTELDAENNVGEKKLQDLFKLKGVSDQWELLRTETTTDANGKTKTTYVYGYKKTLAKGSTTDKLFEKVQMKNSIEKDLEGNVEDVIVTACAIQATDIPDVNLTPDSDGTLGKDVLDQVYTIFMNQSGDKLNQDGQENAPVLGTITYDLDGGTMADDSGIEYTKNDYGKYLQTMISKKPEKTGYIFKGWEPETLASDTTGDITATAIWVDENEVLGNITFDYDGGEGEPLRTFYTAADYGNPMYSFFDRTSTENPQKDGYVCWDFDPYSITSGTTGDVTVKVNWKSRSNLISGQEFNAKVKALGGENACLMGIIKSDDEYSQFDVSEMTEDNIVSLPGEKFPAYIYKNDESSNEVYLVTTSDLYNENPDCSYMYDGLITGNSKYSDVLRGYSYFPYKQEYRFRNCTALQGKDLSIGVSHNYDQDSNDTQSLEGIFEGCSNLQGVRLSGENGRMKNLKNLFKGCVNLEEIRFDKSWDSTTGLSGPATLEVASGADTTNMLNLKGDSTAERTSGDTLTIYNASESFKEAAQKCNLGLDGVQLVFKDSEY